MVKNDDIVVQKFVKNWLTFYDDINEKRGIIEDNLGNLEQSLIDLKSIIYNKGSVPIEVASIFIDMYSSIESLSYTYDDKNQIIWAADHLAVLARDICSC